MADTSVIFRLLAQDETAAGLDAAKSSFAGFGGVLSGILGSEAISGVEDFLKESVNAANTAQQTLNLTAAAIASTGGAAGVTAQQVQEMSDKMGILDGVMPDVAETAANMVLRFTNIKGDNFDKVTQAAIDMAAAMAGTTPSTDQAQAAALKLGKALQDPATGLSALTRSGVTFTAGQKAAIVAMEKAGNTAGAQAAILAAVNQKFAGSAAAVATPLQRLNVLFDEFKVKAGQQLLGAVNGIASMFLRILPAIQSAAGDVKSFFNFIGQHINLFGSIAAGIGLVVGAMKLWALANKAIELGEIMIQALDPADWLVLAIMAVVAVVIYLMTKFSSFRTVVVDVIQDVMRVLGDLAQFIVNTVVGSVELLLKALGSIPIIGGPFKTAANDVDAFRSHVDAAISAVQNLDVAAGLSDLSGFLSDMTNFGSTAGFSTGSGLGSSIGDGIASGLGGAAPKGTAAVESLGDKIKDALTKFKSTIVQSFGALGSVISNQLAGPSGSFTIGAALDAQLAKAKTFVANIALLRSRGLNTTSLNELIAAGPDQGSDAAQALASATKQQISGVNSTESQLNALGNKFANTTASAEFGSTAAIKKNQVYLNFDMSGVSTDDFVKALRKAIRVKGGNVQTVLGGAS